MKPVSFGLAEPETRFSNVSHFQFPTQSGFYHQSEPDPRLRCPKTIENSGRAIEMDCNGVVHTLVRLNMTQNRTCGYCSLMRNVTKAGFAKKSYYECNVCRIPLCRNEFQCFFKYHEIMKKHHLQGPMSKAEFKLYTSLYKYDA